MAQVSRVCNCKMSKTSIPRRFRDDSTVRFYPRANAVSVYIVIRLQSAFGNAWLVDQSIYSNGKTIERE